jgi:hypothetical protein
MPTKYSLRNAIDIVKNNKKFVLIVFILIIYLAFVERGIHVISIAIREPLKKNYLIYSKIFIKYYYRCSSINE